MKLYTVNHPLNKLSGGGKAKYIGPKNEGLDRNCIVEVVTGVYQRGREKFIEVVFDDFRYFNVKPWMLQQIS